MFSEWNESLLFFKKMDLSWNLTGFSLNRIKSWTIKKKKKNYLSKYDVAVKVFWCCFVSFVKFSYWSKFIVNIIVGSQVMTTFQKSEIPLLQYFPIFGHWSKLGIPNLAQMFLMKCYQMLKNAKFQCLQFLSY